MNAVNFNIRFYPLHQHVRELIADGGLGDVRFMTGHYFQDWLLLDTDWNWRLEPDKGGSLRAVGRHRVALARPDDLPDGSPIVSVMADLATFVPQRARSRAGRWRRTRPSARATPSTRAMATEDVGRDPAAVRQRRSRGRVAVSQISAGRKNSLQWEIDGSNGAAAWDSETPDHLWLGHRDRPNEILLRNPALMGAAGRAAAGAARRARGGLRRHVRRAVPGRSTPTSLQGRPSERPPYATFADGHDEMLVGDAIAVSAPRGPMGQVDRSARRVRGSSRTTGGAR